MADITSKEGYLSLFIGPMYSGKTSKLLELYKQFKFCEMPTLVVNYIGDNRYDTTMLSTHDKSMIPCMMCETLSDICDIFNDKLTEQFTDADIILINEGQFFKDIVEWVTIAVNKYHKHVYICGLDGDYKRRLFGNWLDLIPQSDAIIKLYSFCSNCKKHPGIFSHRLNNETQQVLIGADSYIPLCRKCFNDKN